MPLIVRIFTALFIITSLTQPIVAADSLRHKAAKMLMVGFKGDSITPDNPVVGYLKDLKVGGIILFDIDLTGSRTTGSRNITSKNQLAKLTSDLRQLAGYPLLIAADQEGGKVQRLKPLYGYTALPSARQLGSLNNPDSTAHIAEIMADEMSQSGVNVNLAPELDLHRDDCPVIGQLDRAFSSNPDTVTLHAGITIDKLHSKGIFACVKHFPGHGSSTSDSHYGLTDVTGNWSSEELIPFQRLISEGKVDMVMTAHIFNKALDEDNPATLSKTILTGILRNQLGFNGVILTDDMYMQGIIDNYTIKEAIVKAINAGADMLVIGNNITTGFEPDRPARIVDIIVRAVEDGEIPMSRIDDANQRINNLLN